MNLLNKNLIIVTALILLFSKFSIAQKTAITDTGQEVTLYKNGTWEYVNLQDSSIFKLDTNLVHFQKESKATFLLKSKVNDCGIFLNPKKWKFKNSTINEAAEYGIWSIDGSIQALILNEVIEIPLATLSKLALKNARRATEGSIIVENQEFRVVNEVSVLCTKMIGYVNGVKYNYIGYYFSNQNGSTQIVCYTSQKMFPEKEIEMESLLNGFVVLDK